MRIFTKDGNRIVNVGSGDILKSIYSTALTYMEDDKEQIKNALEFMVNKKTSGASGYEVGRQFNVIRDAFSRLLPEDLVFDIDDLEKKAPWTGSVSPVVTSCANLFTTADGGDLFFEIVALLVYAKIKNVDVIIE